LREPTIARNYAEALFQSGERSGNAQRYADLLEGVAGAIAADERIRLSLESPRVPQSEKQRIVAQALKGKAPEAFVRFLSAVIKRRRQGLIGPISQQYLNLLDVKLNRVHASIVVARQPDQALQKDVAARLSRIVGKTVVPHFRSDLGILGGIIVRMGDRIMDGSLRRKMLVLRRTMLGG
jgi:F-type H+-transporting ATPase subunit delta